MNRMLFPGLRGIISPRRAWPCPHAIVVICAWSGLLLGHTAQAAVPINRNVAAQRMNLAATDIVQVEMRPSVVASNELTLNLPIEGFPSTITLRPHSVTAPDFVLRIQLADGSYEDVQPGPITTLRGQVAEIAGADVAATLTDEGLRAMILMPDDSAYWLEPAASVVAGAAADQYLLYHDTDVLDTGLTCALADPPQDNHHKHARFGHRHDLRAEDGEDSENNDEMHHEEPMTATVASSDQPFITELAIDADFEYYLRYGSVSAVEQQVTSIINTVNLQYERDVNITHVITAIIVRTAEPDPYSSTDPNTLLNQVRNQWEFNHSSVHRDVTQLFTGKTIDGSVIGIAWRGQAGTTTICGSWGYSVVESDCNFSCNTFAAKTDLSAHELGHNWGADHCTCGNPPYTMNSTITAANRFHPTFSIPEIEAYRDSRTCISQFDELRRIFLTADVNEVEEFGQVQLNVIADFRYGGDQDVTNSVNWSLDRPVGWISQTTGVLTTFDVLSDLCLTVTASYTFDGITKNDQKVIRIIDLDAPLHISNSTPPNGAIDARQPSDPQATVAQGWQTLDIILNGEVCSFSNADFEVSVMNGFPPFPAVTNVQQLSVNSFRLTFDMPIPPGAWTTVTHLPSGSPTTLGFLPGDVNSDGLTDSSDVTALVDHLQGQSPMLPEWATDLDRSGQTTPADIITLIDLINGAGGFFPWDGATLP
jgi:hypothetical protein